MKFKPNYMLTFSLMMTEIFLSLIPTFIMLDLMEGNTDRILKDLLGVLYLCIIFFVLLNFLNVVTLLFSKVKVCTYQNYFIHNNKEFYYIDIKEIEIEKGFVARMGSEPFTIILRKNSSELTFIENPSIILVILLLCRCKNAKVKIKKWYTIFIWMISIPLIILLIYIISLLSSK